MNTSVDPVSSWQITLSSDEQQIILGPCVAKPGQSGEPVRQFALTLPVARLLQQQLTQSIRLLEQQGGESTAPIERRSTQRPVSNDRRKARQFEGSPSPHAGPGHDPRAAAQPKKDAESE